MSEREDDERTEEVGGVGDGLLGVSEGGEVGRIIRPAAICSFVNTPRAYLPAGPEDSPLTGSANDGCKVKTTFETA